MAQLPIADDTIFKNVPATPPHDIDDDHCWCVRWYIWIGFHSTIWCRSPAVTLAHTIVHRFRYRAHGWRNAAVGSSLLLDTRKVERSVTILEFPILFAVGTFHVTLNLVVDYVLDGHLKRRAHVVGPT